MTNDPWPHDQCFVITGIKEMLDSIIVPEGGTLIITSDNCTCQYKSVQHFHHLQKLATELKTTIIRIYGIAGHGKNEVDCVVGV